MESKQTWVQALPLGLNLGFEELSRGQWDKIIICFPSYHLGRKALGPVHVVTSNLLRAACCASDPVPYDQLHRQYCEQKARGDEPAIFSNSSQAPAHSEPSAALHLSTLPALLIF